MTFRTPLLFSASLCLACFGCEGTDTQSGPDVPAPGQDIDYSFESLDVSTLDVQSRSWCAPPAFTPAGYSGLDRQTFAEVLGDYTSGWMTPLHESLLGLNEVDVWDSLFETVFAATDTRCDWNEDEDLEFLPPSGGELLDPRNQEEVRNDVIDAILNAEELESGDTLRLALRTCPGCAEGLAQHPLFITARITTDGVLKVELGLGQNSGWVQTLYITPDAAVVQAPLGGYMTWEREVRDATPDSGGSLPDIQGVLTAVIRKDNAGGTSATVGIDSLSFDTQPGDPDSVRGSAAGDCIGFHVGISGASKEAQLAASFGHFELTVPGSVNCDASECGPKERTEDWVYELGGVYATVEQPGPDDPNNLYLNVVAQKASTARVGADEFARGGIGDQGRGGHLGLSVDKTPEGFLVSFQPALTMGGAMTISSFSDQLKMNLPDWLNDEIFDLTFGGDPQAQIFVPAREPCSTEYPYEDPIEPARRTLEVRAGTLTATRSGGELVAVPGTCVGRTLLPENSLERTSDWADFGFACE